MTSRDHSAERRNQCPSPSPFEKSAYPVGGDETADPRHWFEGERASIITAAYHMLKDGTFYHDLGYDHFDRRAKTAHSKRLVSRLRNLGYDVKIEPLAA